MAYTGAEVYLGMAEGFRRRRQEQKQEAIAAEDRARRIRREDADDAFREETRARQRKQWAEEDAQTPIRREQRKVDELKLRSMRQKLEQEGALDFLYELDAGGDPDVAVSRYNARGAGRIEPGSLEIRGTRIRFRHSDIDGDGKPEDFEGELGDLIQATERVLGKNRDRKFHNVPQGSVAIDVETQEPVYENPKPATPQRPLVVGPNSMLVDPETRKPIVVPRPKDSGSVGGRKLVSFNPERYNADLQGELARLVGGSYDPATMRFEYGQASKKMPPFTRVALEEAARLNRTMPGEVPAQLIAAIVADAANNFDEDAIREGARRRAIESGQVKAEGPFGLGKPNPQALKEIEDQAVADELARTISQIRTLIAFEEQKALAAREARAQEDEQAIAAEQEEPEAAEAASSGSEMSEDDMPAIEWPANAPPRNLFGRARPGTRIKARGPDGTSQVWVIGPDWLPRRVQ